MSSDNTISNSHRNKRPKTDLACDTCRRRKSRCDGRRPSCTHCETSGIACSYRPATTNFEADVSVLTRLAQAEARISLLEEQLDRSGAPGGQVQNSIQIDINASRIPDFHTAAGHKILQYWPRLRVKMTIPDIEIFTFLRVADRQDMHLMDLTTGDANTNECELLVMIHSIEMLYGDFSSLPVSFVDLFNISPHFSETHILRPLYDARNIQETKINLQTRSIEELLVYSLAASITSGIPGSASKLASETCFKIALQNFWKAHSETDDYVIPVTLFYSQMLLYFFARPFHALGMLQSIQPAISRLTMNRIGDVSLDQQKRVFNRLYFLLESDILTEVDGVPSANDLSKASAITTTQNDCFVPLKSLNHPTASTLEYFMRCELFLRVCLNRILSTLYTVNEAYIHPHDAGPIISGISLELNNWYQALPLHMQFARNIASFNLSSKPVPKRLQEISLRYYACNFILNRVVLYFVVYEDMEQFARTPGSGQGFAPWVLDSCRNCIENAGLIILSQYADFLSHKPRSYSSWCELQLLVGAYAVLLQIQTVPALAPMFRDLGEIDHLLDSAELVLSRVPFVSLSTERTLDILRNMRHNFTLGTPQGSAISPENTLL